MNARGALTLLLAATLLLSAGLATSLTDDLDSNQTLESTDDTTSEELTVDEVCPTEDDCPIPSSLLEVCDLVEDATIDCPVPPGCTTDQDCDLPKVCTITEEAMRCTLDLDVFPDPMTGSYDPCRPHPDLVETLECTPPRGCEQPDAPSSCIPPDCIEHEDGILHCSIAPDTDASRSSNDAATRLDCTPIDDRTLECHPPPCLEPTSPSTACTVPDTCERAGQMIRCSLPGASLGAETNRTSQADTSREVRADLQAIAYEAFQPMEATIEDLQASYHEQRNQLEKEYEAAKDRLREEYRACLEHQPEEQCRTEAQADLADVRETLRQQHEDHKQRLLEMAHEAKQATCKELKIRLTNTLADYGHAPGDLHRFLTPTQVPACSGLLLGALDTEKALDAKEVAP